MVLTFVGGMLVVTGIVTTIKFISEIQDPIKYIFLFFWSGLPLVGGGAVIGGLGINLLTNGKEYKTSYWDIIVVSSE